MRLVIILLKRSPQYAKSCRKKGGTTDHAQVEQLYSGSEFNHFKSVSCDELPDLVSRSSLKSCMLDPIPTSVLKNCFDLLLPSHCQAISQETITWLPTMQESQTYISNLMFLSKCCEKVAASQFISHLRENKLEEIFQSAYKVGHSTESALLWVHYDVLCALDDERCVMLILLDLSAAFDTLEHGILLSRLSQCVGVQDSAFTWFESYLSSRSQFVQIRDTCSSDRQLTCGFPQGSVLGPILYLVYTFLSEVSCVAMVSGFTCTRTTLDCTLAWRPLKWRTLCLRALGLKFVCVSWTNGCSWTISS